MSVQLSGALTTVTCYRCDTDFAIPEVLHRVRQVDHQSFWCPLGHEQHWPEGKTRTELAEERAVRAERATANALEEARILRAELTATKSAATKARNRAAAGVCPCCQRSFVQLARHIASKHSGLAPEVTKANTRKTVAS